MKKSKQMIQQRIGLALAFLMVSVSSFCNQRATPGDSSTHKYNVIYILADDLGYSELGCYGNTFNETPHLDLMAAEGLRFTDSYAAGPVCSPSRAALMTGKYPARLHITDYLRADADKHLSPGEITMAEMFRQNGYHTGIVGKWHLSGYVRSGAPVESPPELHGFDEVVVSANEGIGHGSYFYPYHFNKDIQKKLPDEHEYITDRQNLEALEFIDRNKDKPFFLFLSHYAVHSITHGKPELVDHFRAKPNAGTSLPTKENAENDPYKHWPADSKAKRNNPHLAAQLAVIDDGVGAIMDKLEALGIAENTIVVFNSDNGGALSTTRNTPLRGGKGMLYEGGVREPMIIWNPGLFKPAVIHTPVSNYDMYPTFMELIGAKPNKQALDGISLARLLKDSTVNLGQHTLYWHYPLDKPNVARSAGSIRKGDWKLIQFFNNQSIELYNLKQDLSEVHNVADKYPDLAKSLLNDLKAWQRAVKAEFIQIPKL